MEIRPNSFCPNSQFEKLIVELLNKHLFSSPIVLFQNISSTITSIHDIYEDMKKICDFPDIDKKYMVDGSCLKVNSIGLTTQGHIYAGHDLPIWINDPDSTDCKIMIIGRDSGRLPRDMYEMKPTRDQITIYSPFGMHSRYHRRKTQIIPKIVFSLLNHSKACEKRTSVYITDFYKFRKVDPTGVDKDNTAIYESFLNDEITQLKPNVIILLGKTVLSVCHNALGISNSLPYFIPKMRNNGIYVILIPHPSGSNNREIKNAKKACGYTSRKNIVRFYDAELKKAMHQICCNK